MIKVKNIQTWGFEHAIRGMRAKGYRLTKTGYEVYTSVNSKTLYLGIFKTEEEAKKVIFEYRRKRFVDGCKKINLDPYEGVWCEKKYIVFPSGRILNLHGKEIKGRIDHSGYEGVVINGKYKLMHRIVAENFIENPNHLEQVNHIDGNKTNNSVENLEWCTRSCNLKHAYKIGLEKKVCGEQHHASKLTDDYVRTIRSVYKKRDKEFGAVPLGEKYGVDRSVILDVVNRKIWRHVL